MHVRVMAFPAQLNHAYAVWWTGSSDFFLLVISIQD